jgi:hypothetical protein
VIALAFAALDGHFRAPRREVAQPDGSRPVRAHLREVVRVGAGLRPIINLASLVEAVTQRVRGIAPLKEP